MNRVQRFWRSTIGKKVVMAVTGLIMVAFVIAHMLGNLQLFAGPARFNGYSHLLHGPLNEALWVVRIVLLASVVLHIVAAYQLTRVDVAARPVGYARWRPQASTVASRTMRWGGVALALFIIFHLLHFTTLTVQPVPATHADIYSNVTGSFRIWWVALIYVLAMIALGLHLFHGAWSSVRTLGLERPRPNPLRRPVALAIAVIVWAGFTLIPVAVFAGWVR